MEGPVLTTPSEHRIRSAVSACAQPTHSYLDSSYLGTGIQCGSNDSGGCIKKFHSFGRNGDSSYLDKLNLTRKGVGEGRGGRGGSGGGGGNENSTFSKKPILGGRACLNQYCGFRVPPQVQVRVRKHRPDDGKDVTGNISSAESPDGHAGAFSIKNEYISKLTVNRGGIDAKNSPVLSGTKTLKRKVSWKRDKAIVNGEKNVDGDENCSCEQAAKILNLCGVKNRNRIKRKNSRKNASGSVVLFTGKNDGEANKETSSKGLECHSCGPGSDGNDEVKGEKQESLRWLPKHLVTRRTAQIVREIRNAWERRVGTSRLVPTENVQLLFNDLQLFPSASQVSEMLKCAQECSKNPCSKHLTFGEFYKFADDLIRTDCRISSASPSPRIFEKNAEKSRGKLSRGMSKYEVFLGGSCNPTTWRTDLAIPELENMNITYYNPQQVEEWRPELMEAEHQAKENATVMFFVIDNQTRGISALIEVAHLAGNHRKLILVIQSYTQKNQIISNEEISQKEYEDLKVGQEVLQDLVERQRIPVFEDIKDALKSTERILREGLTAQDLQDPNRTFRYRTSLSPRDVFDKLDLEKTGKILARETCLAVRLLYRRNISPDRLETGFKSLGNNLNGIHWDRAKIDFDSYMKLIEELGSYEEEEEEEEERQPGNEETGSTLLESHFPRHPEESANDVYLGGTLENTDWRNSIAIPLLASENLRYFAPKVCPGDKEFTDIEAVAMETSFVLLFVITDTARSIAAMAIAGHYIGWGANVVLCVQPLAEGAQLGGEILTDRAVKDYNRGRMYLADIAKRSGVPVFDRIADAVLHAVERCKSGTRRDVGQQ